jgi:hypothetical protein
MPARRKVTGVGCTCAALSILMVAVVRGAGARSASVGRLRRISGASALPASCVVPGAFVPDSEVEPSLAVDRRDPSRLVAVWQQDRFVAPGGARSNVTASSRDGGRHWRMKLVPGVSRCSGGDFERATDPWLSIGPEGTIYLSSLPVTSSLSAPAITVNRFCR